jgi:hypothetical protein
MDQEMDEITENVLEILGDMDAPNIDDDYDINLEDDLSESLAPR